jgi:Flp pilus assembly protein TadG
MRPLWRDSRGQVLVLLALMLVVLMGIAALALDGGMAYGVKAKMNAAADAAAIAALRERTSQYGTDTSASVVASNYFNANFPSDSMGIPHPTCSVDIATKKGCYVATVEATTVVPTLFARVLGWRGLTLTARSEATRGNVDVALVLDTSGSLVASWGKVRPAAEDFVNRFSEDNDRVALVPFADGVGLRDSGGSLVLTAGSEINPASAAPRFRRDSVNTKIDALVPGGFTATEFGMRIALDQLNKVPVGSRADRRAIVLFSDGAPNTFAGAFLDTSGNTVGGTLWSGNISTAPTRLNHADVTSDKTPNSISLARVPSMGGGNQIGSVTLDTVPVKNANRSISYDDLSPAGLKCNANKAARNLAENMASAARSQGIVIYAIGFGNYLDAPDISSDCSMYSEKGSTILKRMANIKGSDTYDPNQPTGAFCNAVSAEELARCFDAVYTSLMRLTR